jgi:hypothetical protein
VELKGWVGGWGRDWEVELKGWGSGWGRDWGGGDLIVEEFKEEHEDSYDDWDKGHRLGHVRSE